MERRVILASGSPRRRELINQIGWKPEVIPSTVEEKTEETLPDKVVESLSFQKAKDVAARLLKGELEPGCLIVGADTVVAAGRKILGKPKDRKDAAEMLSAIQGDVHQVYTGVTVMVYRGKQKEGEAFAIRTFSERTDVWVYPMTEKEIQDYIATGEPMDKAGAYGIQGRFGAFIEKIQGDYSNVVGLPIGRLYYEVKRMTGSSEDCCT